MKSRRRGRMTRGAAAVEFALILPVFLVLFLGILEFARLGMAMQLLTTAAREGCRVAALPNFTAAQVQARVNSVLTGSGIPTTTMTLTPSDPTTAAGGTPVTLSLSLPFTQVSWLGTSSFMNVTLHASASFTSENP